MGRTGRAILLALGLTGAASPALAQWLRYPTEGVPRKADGKPDLTAPAPRLPDGKPDLSGIWHAAQTPPAWTAVASSARAAAPPVDRRSAATWVGICLVGS